MASRRWFVVAVAASVLAGVGVLARGGPEGQAALSQAPTPCTVPSFPPGYHPSEEELEAALDAAYECEYGDLKPNFPAPYTPPRRFRPDPQIPAEIIEVVEFPTQMGYEWVNAWYGPLGRFSLAVLAASYTGERAQGVLAIKTYNRFTGEVTWTDYPTPTRGGPARIMSWSGKILTIQTRNGDVFGFDVRARKYV